MTTTGRTGWYRDWVDPDTLPMHVREALEAPNLASILELRRRTTPGKTALIALADDENDRGCTYLSYEDLVCAIFRTARAFRALGQSRYKAVLFLGLPSPEGLIAFWGAQIFGSVCPVNPMLSAEQLHRLAQAIPAAAIVAPSSSLSPMIHAKAIMLGEALGCPVVIADDAADAPTPTLVRLAAGLSGAMPESDLPSGEDIVACFPTGGTTGLPKIARLSHRNQLAGIIATALIHDPAPEIVTANGLPLFHVGGGVIATTRALVLGQTLVQLSPIGFRATRLMARFWDAARTHAISQLIAVPTVFSDLIDRWPGGANPIRYFIAGASKLPAQLSARYEAQFGIGVHEGYGMTECSGFATGNAVSTPPRAGSAGRPLPFYEVRTAATTPAGAIRHWCAPGERGRVLVRGPAVFTGYSDAARTQEKFLIDANEVRWLDTGDLGSFDAQGDLWLTGRDKDIIIRGGHNIDATSIETSLLAHPAVAEAAAVGLPDARVGELPIVFATLATGQTVTEADLFAFARARAEEPAAAPVRVIILDTLPMTAMNKIFKPELRRRALEFAIEPLIPAELGLDAIQVLLEENGDLHVRIPSRNSADLTALSEFLCRVSVRHSWTPAPAQGVSHA